MKPVKVCFTSLYAYHLFNPASNSRFGGSETQLYYLATELAKDSTFDVNFLVGDFGQKKEEKIEGVKVYRTLKLKKRPKLFSGIILLFSLLVRFLKIDADIYIQRAVGVETSIIGFFSKIFGKKFIYMVANDEDIGNKIPSYFPKNFFGKLRWKLFVFGLKRADLIFVQHEGQKESLSKNYGKEGIIRKTAFEIDAVDASKKDGSILWVGKADKFIKQPEIFIDLAKNFPEQKFILVCPVAGDKDCFDKIKSLASNEPNIQFIEHVPFNEIDRYFLKAKVFVNTSSTEGFPNTFIQAAKNKTPILSLNINPGNLLGKYNIGFCSAGNFDNLNKDLEELLRNQGKWEEMSENAYQYAKENHDLKKIVEEDKKIILSLIK